MSNKTYKYVTELEGLYAGRGHDWYVARCELQINEEGKNRWVLFGMRSGKSHRRVVRSAKLARELDQWLEERNFCTRHFMGHVPLNVREIMARNDKEEIKSKQMEVLEQVKARHG